MFTLFYKVLEEVDAMSKIRRFAGTSGGAIVTTLLAIGYDAEQVSQAFTKIGDITQGRINHSAKHAGYGEKTFFKTTLTTLYIEIR